MKSVQDYMNDPRITNDPEMMATMESIREIHAIRLKIQDETAGMTAEERNKRAEVSLAKRGLSICYDLVGRGKSRLRAEAVT
jgi:hypothetical protein